MVKCSGIIEKNTQALLYSLIVSYKKVRPFNALFKKKGQLLLSVYDRMPTRKPD